MITFKTQGTCSKQIQFEVENNLLTHVSFEQGCPGNTTAISRLVEGRPVAEIVTTLKGITCGNKSTSCPDQLAKALEQLQHQLASTNTKG